MAQISCAPAHADQRTSLIMSSILFLISLSKVSRFYNGFKAEQAVSTILTETRKADFLTTRLEGNLV